MLTNGFLSSQTTNAPDYLRRMQYKKTELVYFLVILQHELERPHYF